MKRYANSDSEIDDEDIDELKALFARRFHRGKGKYKGRVPIICFNCHEVGHIVARCPKKKNKRNKKDEHNYKNRDEKYEDIYKSRKDDDYRSNKEKSKKSCYIVEKESDSESSMSDEIEVVYVAMKDDSDEDTTTLISYVNRDDKWIIYSGCSHHMTSDKNKFKTFESCDGNSVKFGKTAKHPT